MAEFEAVTLAQIEAMSLDELDAWRAQSKKFLREQGEIRRHKVAEWHLAEAVAQLTKAAQASGRTLEQQAWYWLVDEEAQDAGHRVQAGLYLRSIGKAQ